MKLEDIRPHHCYARAQRLLAEAVLVREELGRSEDSRPALEITDAQPRECYFEALATWQKASRLGAELGVPSPRFPNAAPPLADTQPGHVLGVIDAALAQIEAIKQRLGISEKAAEPAIESSRKPSDVLATLVRINRDLSRSLERPFTPSDCFGVVALANSYAERLGGKADLAPFEHKRKPAHCYQRLTACLQAVSSRITKAGHQALTARGTPTDILPGDVYDLASLVLGELAFLHALTPNAAPVHAFEPPATGVRLPAHVDQLARTLEAQLSAIG
jgi:hypothetical protein